MSKRETLSVEARLALVEDRLAILDILAGSPISSDTASEAYWQSMYSHNAVMDRGDDRVVANRNEIIEIVRSVEQASAIDNGMAHLASLPHIRIEGDRAIATGYLQVLVVDRSSPEVCLPGKGSRRVLVTYHLTVNRWEFERTGQGWKITKRTIRPMGTPAGRQLLSRGLASSD
jgi:hypothetical protein